RKSTGGRGLRSWLHATARSRSGTSAETLRVERWIATQSRPRPRSDDGAWPGSAARASERRIDPGGFGVRVRRIKRARILEIGDPASQGLAAWNNRPAAGLLPLRGRGPMGGSASAAGGGIVLPARGPPVVGEDPLHPVGVGVGAAGEEIGLVGSGPGLRITELGVGAPEDEVRPARPGVELESALELGDGALHLFEVLAVGESRPLLEELLHRAVLHCRSTDQTGEGLSLEARRVVHHRGRRQLVVLPGLAVDLRLQHRGGGEQHEQPRAHAAPPVSDWIRERSARGANTWATSRSSRTRFSRTGRSSVITSTF